MSATQSTHPDYTEDAHMTLLEGLILVDDTKQVNCVIALLLLNCRAVDLDILLQLHHIHQHLMLIADAMN